MPMFIHGGTRYLVLVLVLIHDMVQQQQAAMIKAIIGSKVETATATTPASAWRTEKTVIMVGIDY